MVKKAVVGRLVRDSFDAVAGVCVLELSSSALANGNDRRPGLGGLPAACHLTGASRRRRGCLRRSAVAMARGRAATGGAGARAGGRADRPPAARPADAPCCCSVPSSGGLQFLADAAGAARAGHRALGNPADYAGAVDVVSVCGGFLAGIALSATPLSARTVLGFGLLAAAALAAALGAADGAVLVAALAFLLTFAITAHIVCMQVLTNQVPEPHEVGQFAVLRNTVASLAKAGFAFAAGVIAGATSAQTAAVVLVVSLLAFALAWPALGLRSRVVLEAAG